MKHVVCFSGGHSSALVALEVVRKFGRQNVILLNHNVPKEDADVKRFKAEVAAYLGMDITYANMDGISDAKKIPTQFDIARKKKALSSKQTHQAICTYYLKTAPFYEYLKTVADPVIIYYGFDKTEIKRISRRTQVLGAMGYKTDYPLSYWTDLYYKSTTDVGISPPMGYSVYRHANCVGCLKAGILHWYVVWCTDRETYMDAVDMEEEVGFTINQRTVAGKTEPISLEALMPIFCEMRELGIPATEHQSEQNFAKTVVRFGLNLNRLIKPCECVI